MKKDKKVDLKERKKAVYSGGFIVVSLSPLGAVGSFGGIVVESVEEGL